MKPIVRQYLIAKGDPYRANANDTYGMIIPNYLTKNFEERYTGTIPGQVNMTVQLQKKYSNHFLKANDAAKLSIQLERMFWKDAKSDILTLMLTNRNKSLAMRQFYEHYNITDEILSQDNFYRQLTRNEVPAAELKVSLMTKPMFNCVSDVDANEIARLYYKEKISCRQIANAFGISHPTVSTIVKKMEKSFRKLA